MGTYKECFLDGGDDFVLFRVYILDGITLLNKATIIKKFFAILDKHDVSQFVTFD